MSQGRSRGEKAAVTLAAIAVTWVIGATMFYGSGGLNTAGLLPSTGCLIALWGALRSDAHLMWFGSGVVIVSAVAFVFSIGLTVAPAGLALIAGSLLLARTSAADERSM
jgi:hypothetical protein